MTEGGAALIRDTAKGDAIYALACRLLPPLRAVAREKGYALAYHGSLARDIDLIAVPWLDSAVDAPTLAETIRAEAERITGHGAFWLDHPDTRPTDYTRHSPEPRAHGRLGWSIHIGGSGTYIDLSVVPAGSAHVDARVAELKRQINAAYDQILKQSEELKELKTQTGEHK